ncbi:MAG: class I adenylate-forming enzyme family protein [Porticoccaceae bacterium]|uniref:class I adenylate-forming enzyme family protein n=1 Tax=Thalassospira sp. TaxID=1912094 RepID=UPI003A85AFF0
MKNMEKVSGRDVDAVVSALPERVSHKVWEWIAKTPTKDAVIDRKKHWTYADLGKAIERAKQHLKDHGVVAGDRIMVVIENCCPIIAFMLAASDMNVWITVVNARMSNVELDGIRSDCDPKHLIGFVEYSEDAKRYCDHVGCYGVEDDILGALACQTYPESAREPVMECGKDQVFAMIYTSGTTGKPKGVMLTHRNIGFIATVSGALRGLEQSDRVYVVLPISHVFGLASTCAGSLFAGATLFMESRFDVEVCLRALRDSKITVMQGVPPMYSLLIDGLKNKGLDANDLYLRYMSAGGAPLDPETKAITEEFFKMPLHNGYGLTETSPTVSQVRLNEDIDNCSVGKPIPGVEVKLMKAADQEAAHGETGELWVRGPNVMKGYFRKPRETEAILNDDGWLNTQDLARFDEDGNIFIVGRSKEMIVRSGFNVYPAEVEAVLNSHDGIVQSAVVGVTIPGNEDVHAFVQVPKGSSLTEADIKAFCKDRLTAYKRPSWITVLNELPASSTGKILKQRLREIAQSQS